MSLGLRLILWIGPKVPIPAPVTLVDAIQSVEVTNTDAGRDGFQITFSVGRSGSADVLDYQLLSNPLLKPFNRVIIMMAFGVVPKVLIDGVITHQQLNPSNEPGQSTLTVTGEDVSVMMDLEEKSATHKNQPANMIVTKIILSYALYGLTPKVIPPKSMDIPIEVERVPSQHGTDLSYILELAKVHDYVFYVEPTVVPGVNTAYWGPSDRVGFPQRALSFNMGPETNVNSVDFQYNSLTPSVVQGSIQDPIMGMTIPIPIFGSLRPSLASQPASLSQPNVRSKQFRDSGLSTVQAFIKAQSEVDSSSDAVTVSGELDSMRYGDVLRARGIVGLRGVGYSYDGVYYVKSVTHRIKQGEYKQTFSLVREGLGSITPAVVP
jgi:hypothetical protein